MSEEQLYDELDMSLPTDGPSISDEDDPSEDFTFDDMMDLDFSNNNVSDETIEYEDQSFEEDDIYEDLPA